MMTEFSFFCSWTIPLRARMRWSWVRCLKCTAFFSDARSSCLCGLGGCLKSARLVCEWIWLWLADVRVEGLLFLLKPHWCDWVSMATGGPWAQSLAWDKFWVERRANSHPSSMVCVFAPETDPIRTLCFFSEPQIQQLLWGQESSGKAKRCHYGRQ